MNLKNHQARVNRTYFLSGNSPISLKQIIGSIKLPITGVYKLRISYSVVDKSFLKVTCNPYKEKKITSLQLVIHDTVDYRYKAENRSILDGAFAQKKKADDIIIVVNGELTDSWYCNIALWNGKQWNTPMNCLLKGTMREKLITKSMIHPSVITLQDLQKYSKVRLFNALIPWYRQKDVSIDKVYLPL